MMTHQYILPLSNVQATLENVGGKGASLARLASAGLPVPAGFHVTTQAYKRFVAENGLQPRVLAALERADAAQPATLEAASAQIHALFAQAQMPPPIAEEIRTAYLALDSQSATCPELVPSLPRAEPKGETEGQSRRIENPQFSVAVRSSATAEDLPGLSFAGQQDTFLNVRGADAVLDAVKRCWASLWTARAIGYRLQHAIDQDAVSLAVVVQQLVDAGAAGILFTANPVSGQREQMMIAASWGLGEAIVGGMVTPDTLTVDKATGKVLARETTDKQVMTVRLEDGTQEQPTPEHLRRASVLSDAQAAELTRLGVRIEQLYGTPMDIEWTLTLPSPSGRGDGGEGSFAIVQARPITTLGRAPLSEAPLSEASLSQAPLPQVSPPTEWPMPNPKGFYMRGSVVDLMPEPLSPLFESLGIAGIVRGVDRAGLALTRTKPVLMPDYFTTINSYAYMDAGFPAGAWWWIITGLLPAYPRMLKLIVPFWRDEVRPQYQSAVAEWRTTKKWRGKDLDQLTPAELWRDAQQIVDVAMYYVGALMFATMGASAGAEGLLTKAYEKLAQREGDPPAATLLMGYNSIPVRADKSLYDLAMWCKEQARLAAYVLATPSEQLAGELARGDGPGAGGSEDHWDEFRRRFEQHLDQYGYIIYELDFAKPLPLDTPAPMLETIKMYMQGLGVNPHERQQAAQARREQTAQAVLARLKGLKLWAFRKALGWGQTMAQVREDALADIGLGYPLLRRMLRELGRHLVDVGVIQQAEDVFWLVREEIDAAVAGLEHGQAVDSPQALLFEQVAQRKAFRQAAKRATPPPMIPMKKRYMGFDTNTWVAVSESDQAVNLLKGVATSAGQVTAPARVLRGPEDFSSMRPGDILVAATTTPAWTPLFAMASAVVTDIGGPLSHGSIVAREYGIPAVMGTGIATRRIQSGQVITVDGSAGTVALHAR